MSVWMEPEELDQICETGAALVGANLQRVLFDEKALQLGFWQEDQHKMTWLTVVLEARSAYAFLAKEVRRIRPLKKPLSEFLAKHALQSRLRTLQRDRERGRVLWLELEAEDHSSLVHVEICLVPGYLNLGVRQGDRWVWAKKPRPLPAQQNPLTKKEPRPVQFFFQLWQGESQKEKVSRDQKAVPNLVERIEKKKRTLQKVREELSQGEDLKWRQVGEWLKAHPHLTEVPSEWASYLSPERGLAWNLENCFSKARKIERKRAGTQERISELVRELEELRAASDDQAVQDRSQVRSQPGVQSAKSPDKGGREGSTSSLLYKAQAKGRTFSLPEGTLYLGKSGTDNLKLLRQAKPWFVWFHIRDYPGTFGILEIPKGQSQLEQETVVRAAEMVVISSLREKAQGAFDVLYTECRYVRPIKGAKAGQVTYSHERVVRVKVDNGRGQVGK